jgi:WD40 repeat protein
MSTMSDIRPVRRSTFCGEGMRSMMFGSLFFVLQKAVVITAHASEPAAQPVAEFGTLATVSVSSSMTGDAEWVAGDSNTVLAGVIPAPAEIPGLGRWQAMMLPVSSYVEAAVFSPDGNRIAFGDGTYVRIHDAKSLNLKAVLVGHSGNVRAVGWSPDGTWIASGGDDATVRIWTADGIPAQVMEGHQAPVRDVTWHPLSKLLATAAMDGSIRFWGTDGKAGSVIEEHQAPVNTISWSPDGKWLAAGDENRTVRLWTSDGMPGPILTGHDGAISRVRWSPDGKWLASSCMGLIANEPGQEPNATTRLWQADGTAGSILRGHTRAIRGLAWSPDSRQLVTAGEDRQVLLWSSDGTLVRRMVNLPQSQDSTVFSLDWNGDADQILAGGRFCVRFLDDQGPTGSTKLIRPAGGKLYNLDWCPSSDQIAVATDSSGIYIWSGDLRRQSSIPELTGFVGCVQWSPDGRRIATAAGGTGPRIWDAEGTLLRELQGENGSPATGLAWSSDGLRLAVSNRFGASSVFDMDGNHVTIGLHGGGVGGVTFGPDGKFLATGGLDATVRISQISDLTRPPKEIAMLQAFDGDVDSIAWSPDGEWIASGHNTTARLWHADGSPGPVLPAGDAAVMRLDWSPDSQRLATGSWDTSVRLWNLEGVLLKEFPNHAAPCYGVSFSPDGTKLASCGWDGVVRVLDVESGGILGIAVQVADSGGNRDANETAIYRAISFNRAGQVTSGDPELIEQQLVYLIERPAGAFEILKPSEFRRKAADAVLSE